MMHYKLELDILNLMKTYLIQLYSKYIYNDCFRPMDIWGMEFEEQSSFKIASPRIDFITANIKAAQNDQRTLLNNDNILRAKRLTNTNYCGESYVHAVKSETPKIIAPENKANDEKQAIGILHTVGMNEAKYGVNIETYNEISNAQPSEILFGDKYIQMTKVNKFISSDNSTTRSFEEYENIAADYNLVSTRLKISQENKTNNHLDGQIPSNGASEEVHAGQMTSCTDASSGFECDGNRFTSFTKNSTE